LSRRSKFKNLLKSTKNLKPSLLSSGNLKSGKERTQMEVTNLFGISSFIRLTNREKGTSRTIEEASE